MKYKCLVDVTIDEESQMAAAVVYAHIDHNKDGVAYIVGTRTKVRQVALDQIAYGWTAEDMHRNHPYLTLGQIHSALTYYHDHQDEIEYEIEEELRFVNEFRERQGETSNRLKLKAKGLLS